NLTKIPNTMLNKSTLAKLAVLAVLSATPAFAQLKVAVDFLGRDEAGSNNAPNPQLDSTETAGVVPQQYWNDVADYNFTPPEQGSVSDLSDSTGNDSGITLIFDCNDSWANDTGATVATASNAKMMLGIVKDNG